MEKTSSPIEGPFSDSGPFVERASQRRLNDAPATVEADQWFIHWKVPTVMIGTFIWGMIFALGHHLLYLYLDGKSADEPKKQQWALRFGVALAFFARASFVTAITVANVQCIWWTMRRKAISIQGIDAAFVVQHDFRSFFSWEMISRFKTVTVLALIGWLLPISALVTPATLSVGVLVYEHDAYYDVQVPKIGDRTNSSSFASMRSNMNFHLSGSNASTAPAAISGATTFLSRIAAASASTGQLLQLKPLSPNASYSLEFQGPSVHCAHGNASITQTIYRRWRVAAQDIWPRDVNSSVAEVEVLPGYFAFTPFMDIPGSDSSSHDIEYAQNLSVVGSPSLNPFVSSAVSGDAYVLTSNQIWLMYVDNATDPSKIPEGYPTDQFNTTVSLDGQTVTFSYASLICKLYNTSYKADVLYNNGLQTVSSQQKRLDYVYYPTNVTMSWGADGNIAFHDEKYGNDQSAYSYTAFMQAFMSQIQGLLGFNFVGQATYQWSPIAQSSLMGSSDLIPYFNFLSYLGGERPNSGSLNNGNLKSLIQQLSVNMTLNLMSDTILSKSVNTTVRVVDWRPAYVYSPTNLYIAYSIATFFTLISIGLGLYAIRANGADYMNYFSTVVRTTVNPELAALVSGQSLGAQPRSDTILNTRVQFGLIPNEASESDNGRLVQHAAFGLQGRVKPLETGVPVD